MKKNLIILAAGLLLVGAGCTSTTTITEEPTQPSAQDNVEQTQELETYSNDQFILQYPSDYTVSTDEDGTVTITGDKGKFMIGTFEIADAPVDAMSAEEIDQLPKNQVYYGFEGEVTSVLYYQDGDDETEAELKAIQASVELVKETPNEDLTTNEEIGTSEVSAPAEVPEDLARVAAPFAKDDEIFMDGFNAIIIRDGLDYTSTFALNPRTVGFLNIEDDELLSNSIQYADVTGDGVAEAIVPIPGDGNVHSPAILIYSFQRTQLKGIRSEIKLLGEITGYSMRFVVKNGDILIYTVHYVEGDTYHNPSFFDVETYSWNGKEFVSVKKELIETENLETYLAE